LPSRLYEYTQFLYMDKRERQQAILQLIESDRVSSQERLRMKLAKLGFDVTQATLSRDLRELHVIKTATGEGSYRYAVMDRWMGLPIRQCEVSGNLLVVRTDAGMAPAVAYKIDELKIAGVLGTVAGEDTLLVVVGEGYDARGVRRELWNRAGEA
jgi:transcriptional regulator of arginine metabolism